MAGAPTVPSVPVMSTNPAPPRPTSLGLPGWQLAALSLLMAPRVVLHDLGLIPNVAVAALLALVPAAVWVLVIARSRARSPILALLLVGLCYGLVLAVVHNLLWEQAYADMLPTLGGNLEGRLPAGVEQSVLRTAMSVSSLFTALVTGLICGLLAHAVRRAVPILRP